MIKIDPEYPLVDRLDCCHGSDAHQHSEIKGDVLLIWQTSDTMVVPGSFIAAEYDHEGRIKREYSDANGNGKIICSTGDYEGRIDYKLGIFMTRPCSWPRRMINKIKRLIK